ncbi:MAG: hypothetical protein EOP04_07665 [Proteobacteria bacterium]|nr:MAG: hypothetical protein EOP04_07665 [Pseudomonadota bacterium]
MNEENEMSSDELMARSQAFRDAARALCEEAQILRAEAQRLREQSEQRRAERESPKYPASIDVMPLTQILALDPKRTVESS